MFFDQKYNTKVKNIDINQIRPNASQPRTIFKQEELESLKDSIKENGILQPLTVRKLSQSSYELIAGERRLRACSLLGFKTVPCILVECDENQSAIYALIENIQRSDLNPFEEAEGIEKLIMELGLTQDEAARRLGKKQSTISNKLRLLKLTKEERQILIKEGLSERHARALIKLKQIEDRKYVIEKVIKNNLNVAQTEELVKKTLTQDQMKLDLEPAKRRIIIKDVRIFINTIDKAINTMKISGIDAIKEECETDEYLEYRVKIPKKSAIKRLA